MNDITFTNTGFDPDLVAFHGIAKEMAKSVGYTADMSVDAKLAQLIRLRVAHLASWPESTMFSPAEQVALAYCEGLTDYDLAGFAPLHQAMTDHFSETEIAEIAAIVINMNLWTRFKLAQGARPVQKG